LLKPLGAILAATWLWLRRDLHNFDLTQEPESQHRARRLLLRGIRAMEYDPHTQWHFHLFMTWAWLISAAPILVLFFWFPTQWLRWGLLITLLYSLYANFATDFGAVHAAWAALRGDQISVKQGIATNSDAVVVTHITVSTDDAERADQ
jgi:hypothetical protein